MAIVDGEPFRCNIHGGYTTSSVREWNDHCFGNPEHLEAGLTSCRKCGVIIQYDNLPWQKINEKTGSKNISLLCENCDSQHGNVKVSKVE